MHNSSSNAQSVLGSLLTPSASGTAPQKFGVAAQKRGESPASFSDTLSGARQEVARAKADARRPGHSRPEPDSRLNQPSSSERAPNLQAERARGNDQPAQAPVNPPADQETVTTSQVADGRSQQGETVASDETPEAATITNGEVELISVDEIVSEVGRGGLESESATEQDSVESSGHETTTERVLLVLDDAAPGADARAIPVADIPVSDRSATEHPLTGDSQPAEDVVQEIEIIATGVTPILVTAAAQQSAVVGVTLGAPVASSPADKVSLGSESLLAKSATVAATDSGGDLGAAMSSEQGESMDQGAPKEHFAKLLASTETRTLSREPSTSQAAPAIEAMARAVESLPPAGRGFVVQSGVAPTVGTPQWSQAVGDRVLWLAAQNITSAELRLDPPELGPMQVRVSVHQDQVQVTFTSPHAGVREALDQGAARLREMFNDQGLNLNVEVSDQSLSRRQHEEGSSKGRGNGGDELPSDEAVVAETAISKLRLIDHYA